MFFAGKKLIVPKYSQSAINHHAVGDLGLAYESLDMISEPGLTLTLYAAEPHSSTAQALALLASWAATQPDARQQHAPHGG